MSDSDEEEECYQGRRKTDNKVEITQARRDLETSLKIPLTQHSYGGNQSFSITDAVLIIISTTRILSHHVGQYQYRGLSEEGGEGRGCVGEQFEIHKTVTEILAVQQ